MKPQRLPSKRKLAYFCSFLLVILLAGCSKVLHWSKAEPQYYRVESSAVDTAMLILVEPYSTEMWSEMNEVIGQNAQPLNKEKPEGTLNNWVADVMKTEAERFTGASVDFAVSNYGGIRINALQQGPVTLGRIFEVMPFDNVIVIVQMPGKDLKVFLDHMASEGGWPVSKDMRFTIADSTATDIMINGLPFDIERTYQVAMPDYVANGGDQRQYLQELPRQVLTYLIRDALIANTKRLAASGESIVVQKDGRIKHAAMN